MCECLARALRSWVATSQRSSSSCVHVRWGSNSRSTRLTCGRVIWGIFFPPVLLERQQEGTGEEAQGDVVVPTRPAAHLILIQPRFAFGRLDRGFDDPARRRARGQRQHWRVLRGIGEVI